MCGIAGFRLFGGASDAEKLAAVAAGMARALTHRGPDARSTWVDEASGMALAHARLAVIDLSPAGAQPMASANGRYILAFNGEIYNHRDLRGELEIAGGRFRGASDTETLVECCAAWGLAATLRRLNGIFAFALFDRHERRLSLVRDHLGVKPLYWAHQGSRFFFGSELKALAAHPAFVRELDRRAAASFFRFGYVPAPYSIYRNVGKLAPGTILHAEADGSVAQVSYWSAIDAFAGVERAPRSDAEAVGALEQVARQSIARQMVADVPVGVLLSGGIDSSLVAALAQERSPQPVNSFAIGFHARGFDEAQHAREVARHIGMHHTELYIDASHARDVLPRLPEIYDEPFADPSQVPTCLVSMLSRGQVTVVLSGDGGDELFGGYDRYFHALRLMGLQRRTPPFLRGALHGVLRHAPIGLLDTGSQILPARLRLRNLGTKLRKAAGLFAPDAEPSVYRRLMSHWGEAENPVLGAQEYKTPFWDSTLAQRFPDYSERMMALDVMTYLPDDILTKVDRASMAVGLEARVPLLDRGMVEYALSLPVAQKMRGSTGKWALRQVLYRHVPQSLVDRPKMGFGAPIGAWMKGPLRGWCEDLLSEQSLRSSGILDAVAIRRCWDEHVSGRADWQYKLWAVLMFESWRRRWLSP